MGMPVGSATLRGDVGDGDRRRGVRTVGRAGGGSDEPEIAWPGRAAGGDLEAVARGFQHHDAVGALLLFRPGFEPRGREAVLHVVRVVLHDVRAERRRRKHFRVHVQPDDPFALIVVHCRYVWLLSKLRIKAGGGTIRYTVLYHGSALRRR